MFSDFASVAVPRSTAVIRKEAVQKRAETLPFHNKRVGRKFFETSICYEGCSNMNASSFITFVTYMLRQYGKRFYKGLYVTFKLAPDQKQNTVYLSSYRPLNEGHFSILTNSMLRTYQWYRRAYNCSINRLSFLKFLR